MYNQYKMTSKSEDKTIVVCGVPGKQSLSVVDCLLRYTNFNVRVITDDDEHPKVRFLKNRGVNVFKVDYNDRKTLYKAFRRCYGAFIKTDFWKTKNARDEIKQGMILTDIIKKVDIEHSVWSCMEDTRDVLGDAVSDIDKFKVPHFDAKSVISKYMKKTELPVTYLYTSFCWENFFETLIPKKDENDEYVINMPMEDTELGGVAVDDIGKIVTGIFLKGTSMVNKEIGVVGEYKKLNDIAQTLSKYSGKKYVYKPLTNDEYRKLDIEGVNELANMYKYYTKYDDNFKKFRNTDDINEFIDVTTFEEWADRHFNVNKLTFFNKPGNVEPIRILLRKANVNFYDNRLRINHDAQQRNRQNDDMYLFQLENELPFGYVPIYKENDIIVSNMGPIIRYVANKYNFDSDDIHEKTKLDTILTVTDNLLTKFFKVLNSPNDMDRYNFKNSDLNMIVGTYDKLLLSNKEKYNLEKPIYFSGDKLTYADAVVYNFIKTLISTLKNLRFPESIVIFYRTFDESIEN